MQTIGSLVNSPDILNVAGAVVITITLRQLVKLSTGNFAGHLNELNIPGIWYYFACINMNLFPLISEHISKNPELIIKAKETLALWENRKLAPEHHIQRWKTILDRAGQSEAGRQELINLLQDEQPSSLQLKSFAPFAGLLPREERRKVYTKCTYDH